MYPSFGMFNIMFALFPIIFLGALGFILFHGLSSFFKNNASPVLTVEAVLTGKRIKDSSHVSQGANNMTQHHHDTSYYVTFQVESGDRLEFYVSGREYGQLAEGDRGKLTFQGSRYKGFQRL